MLPAMGTSSSLGEERSGGGDRTLKNMGAVGNFRPVGVRGRRLGLFLSPGSMVTLGFNVVFQGSQQAGTPGYQVHSHQGQPL